MDFMNDSMVGNQKFRTFNVIDDCTGEVQAIEVDTSLSSWRITRTLERFIEQRGILTAIRADNCPEFMYNHFEAWCRDINTIFNLFNQANPCSMAISNDLTGLTGKQYWMLTFSLNSIRCVN